MLSFKEHLAEQSEYLTHKIPMGPYTQDKDNLSHLVIGVENQLKPNLNRYVRSVKLGWLEASQSWLSKHGGGDPVFPDIARKYWQYPVIVKTKKNGRYTILDGHHRIAKAMSDPAATKNTEIQALVFEV